MNWELPDDPNLDEDPQERASAERIKRFVAIPLGQINVKRRSIEELQSLPLTHDFTFKEEKHALTFQGRVKIELYVNDKELKKGEIIKKGEIVQADIVNYEERDVFISLSLFGER